ncbi:MAG TPA: SDR family NAD(P)-dependent oxidoreductase [Polyangiaceae bacterium]|nr:SDR family NAD(P)-dependent oxidoreductase [Polyangiaceae bacterium]
MAHDIHASRSSNGARRAGYALITGGAGFIGSNLAHRLLSEGESVVLFDDLSRPGVERNVAWLEREHGARVRLMRADIRDAAAVTQAVSRAHQVFHFAAQVAVTTSLSTPAADFEVNARGTLNVLEALRARGGEVPLVFTSTNKVYGSLADVRMINDGCRYRPAEPALGEHGISELRHLDFHSPYGCSKGAADQYVLDYSRTFGLRSTVLRMSCIYGPRQFGTEDQGWVAHFVLQALKGAPLTIYGDGCQVRDVLFVADLVDALSLARDHIERCAGRAFNIGGGRKNALSLLELVGMVERLVGRRLALHFSEWRPGDQPYYVSDCRAFEQTTGWQRQVTAAEGIERLHAWLQTLLQRPLAEAKTVPLVAAGGSGS